MPQNEHIELHQKRHGRQLNHFERLRKKEGRAAHARAERAKEFIINTLAAFFSNGFPPKYSFYSES